MSVEKDNEEVLKEHEEKLRQAEKQRDLFYEKVSDLIEAGYEGKYVAFLDGEVLDSDDNRSTLADRVHSKHGWDKIIYIDRVVPEPDKRIVMMPSNYRFVNQRG